MVSDVTKKMSCDDHFLRRTQCLMTQKRFGQVLENTLVIAHNAILYRVGHMPIVVYGR